MMGKKINEWEAREPGASIEARGQAEEGVV